MNRTQICAEARQRAGGHVEIRQACACDRGAIRAFLAGLSLRTRYLRFFTGGGSASPVMVGILLGGRDNSDAVVATEGATIIGHAMATGATRPSGQTSSIEIGVVVADDWQGRGIGSALLREVTARAQARGATTVVMEVLAENRQVLGMIARHWPAAHHTSAGPYVTIHAGLPERVRAGQRRRVLTGRPWSASPVPPGDADQQAAGTKEPRRPALARA